MAIEYHDIDFYPLPKDTQPTYINEPWIIDDSFWFETSYPPKIDNEVDNHRVYVPLDLNKKAILRRLDHIIDRYGEANYKNEFDFSSDVSRLLWQVEIYDQLYKMKNSNPDMKHSDEAVELINDFIARLRKIPDGCAECFPFDTIIELYEEYLGIHITIEDLGL